MARRLVLLLLLGHTVVSVWAFSEVSVWSAFPPFESRTTAQVFSDLAVSMSLVFILLYADLKRRGRPLKPLLITAFASVFVGSFATLIYILWDRELLRGEPQTR